MLISIFDERIRGSYSQGYEPFFKLVNFYENSHEFYNEFSKRNNEKSNVKSTFCSIPCLKEVGIKNESKVVAGCKVLE